MVAVLAGGAALAEPVAAAGPAGMAGSGTDADPYVITNATGLQAMEQDLTASYVLGTDVDASGVTFRPVGNDSVPFDGSFDGRNHTVSNVTVRKPDPEWVGVGLFGRSDGDVGNVTLTAVDAAGNLGVGGLVGINGGEVVRSSATADVDLEAAPGVDVPEQAFGGLVGYNNGTVRASAAAGDVSGSVAVGGLVGANDGGTVTASSASGDVDGQVAAGGLVGYDNGTTVRSSATGTVVGRQRVGVLVGWNEGTVRESAAAGVASGGVAVGGFVGLNDGTVRESSAASDTASTTGSNVVSGEEQAFGGLVGWNRGTVTGSYATGDVSGSFDVGGLVGRNDGGTVTGSYATAAVGGGPGFGEQQVGGLVGDGSGTVARSYWDEDASGQSGSAGGKGRTTAQLTGDAVRTNTSLDVADAWVVTDSYPKLAWAAESLVVSANATVGVGNATAATVTATFAGEAVGDVTSRATYTSSDPGVATVGPDGTITGVDVGTTTVTAELGDARATTTVTVTAACPTIDGRRGIDADGDGRCEDVNGDGAVDIDDPIALLLVDAALTPEGRDALDFDRDGDVDVVDAIDLLFRL